MNYKFRSPIGKLTKLQETAGIVEKQIALPNGFVVCVVEISKITKEDHQRDLDKKWAGNIAKEFNALYADLPFLAYRPGVLSVDEGQHTITAMRDGLTDTEWDQHYPDMRQQGRRVAFGLVHFSLSNSDSCRLYAVKNSRKKKSSGWETFRSSYFAGDERETFIIDSARSYGLNPPFMVNGEEGHKKNLRHPKEYISMYGKDKTLLKKWFAVLSKSFRADKGITLSFVRGFCSFVRRNHGIGMRELQGTFGSVTVEELKEMAKIKRNRCGAISSRCDPLQFEQAFDDLFCTTA